MKNLEQLFKGLADQNRLRILHLLLHGELCVCDIQYVLACPQSNVSRHLTYLKNSSLVLDRREGTRIYYRLAGSYDPVQHQLFKFLRAAFKDQMELSEDTRRLKKAIANGSCTASEFHPYSELVRLRTTTHS